MEILYIAVSDVNELKWTGIGHLQPDNFYSGNDKLRRNGVAVILRHSVAQDIRGYNAKSD